MITCNDRGLVGVQDRMACNTDIPRDGLRFFFFSFSDEVTIVQPVWVFQQGQVQ